MDSTLALQSELAQHNMRDSLGPTLGSHKNQTRAQMRNKAEEFESFFLGQMLQPMFANIEAAEPFNGGSAGKIWKSMMVDEYGKELTKAGGIGIADMVMRELIQMQEGL